MPSFSDHMAHIDAVLAAVLRAADPRSATCAAVRRSPPRVSRPAVIAVGKAAPAMLQGFMDACPGRHDTIVVTAPGVPAPSGAIVADHPVATERSLDAALRVKAFVDAIVAGLAGNGGFVVLLSGGASALLTLPQHGIDLPDYAAAMMELMASGVDIRALNCIRKHCERLKGGRLAAFMHPKPCDTYILCDVIGDDLATVGSGPTLPDPTTFEDAARVFDWQLKFTRAAEVLAPFLRDGCAGRHEETPKPGDPRLAASRGVLVGSNVSALRAAALAAEELGFAPMVRAGVVGDAAHAGRRLVAEALAIPASGAVVVGGETTVDVEGKSGRGGRNLEMALAAALEMDGREGLALATFATDGVDGPTDAAGAVVTGATCGLARGIGLDAARALAEHDSYTFFGSMERAGHPSLIRTGPTGTNVNDVAVALRY